MPSTIFHILKPLHDFFTLNSLEYIFLNICDLAIIHPLMVREGEETVVSEMGSANKCRDRYLIIQISKLLEGNFSLHTFC